jgi:hypothetical protein
MDANAYVTWVVCDHPWELEEALITTLDLPLSLQGNQRNAFRPRFWWRGRDASARTLPVLPAPPEVSAGTASPALGADLPSGGIHRRLAEPVARTGHG